MHLYKYLILNLILTRYDFEDITFWRKLLKMLILFEQGSDQAE